MVERRIQKLEALAKDWRTQLRIRGIDPDSFFNEAVEALKNHIRQMSPAEREACDAAIRRGDWSHAVSLMSGGRTENLFEWMQMSDETGQPCEHSTTRNTS